MALTMQTRDYIKISCESSIDRVLQTHGWDKSSPINKGCHDIVPISTESVDKLQMLKGPTEDSADHKSLEREIGFSYRQVLGELIYAYIVC